MRRDWTGTAEHGPHICTEFDKPGRLPSITEKPVTVKRQRQPEHEPETEPQSETPREAEILTSTTEAVKVNNISDTEDTDAISDSIKNKPKDQKGRDGKKWTKTHLTKEPYPPHH